MTNGPHQARAGSRKGPAADGESPAISIVMGAYNEEKVIGRAIESIVAQTATAWELIVVDDASTDRTKEIVKSFACIDARIKLIVNETNLGLAASLNKGIDIAQGALIARADADDTNHPERLAKQCAFMARYPEIDVVGTGAYLVGIDGRRGSAISLDLTHADLRQNPFEKNLFFHPSVMMRRTFFEKVGGYDVSYRRAQDKELWLRGLESNCLYANIAEPLIDYQMHFSSRSLGSILEEIESLKRMARRYGYQFGVFAQSMSLLKAFLLKTKLYVPRSMRKQS